jgi:hypothetical protein
MAGIDVIIGMSMKASGDNGFDVSRPAPHVLVLLAWALAAILAGYRRLRVQDA